MEEGRADGEGGGQEGPAKKLAGWLAGWLAGCGDADLRVNRGHAHVDLHMFQVSQDVPKLWER